MCLIMHDNKSVCAQVKVHMHFTVYKVKTTNPVLTVRRSTFVIGRHGSGFPSRLSLAVHNILYISFKFCIVSILQKNKKLLTNDDRISMCQKIYYAPGSLAICYLYRVGQKTDCF